MRPVVAPVGFPQNLPPGWKMEYDRDGVPWYWSDVNKESKSTLCPVQIQAEPKLDTNLSQDTMSAVSKCSDAELELMGHFPSFIPPNVRVDVVRTLAEYFTHCPDPQVCPGPCAKFWTGTFATVVSHHCDGLCGLCHDMSHWPHPCKWSEYGLGEPQSFLDLLMKTLRQHPSKRMDPTSTAQGASAPSSASGV